MTRDDAKQLLPIIAAYAEGKKIQLHCADQWDDISDPEFNAGVSKYRIKPETMKVRVYREKEGRQFITSELTAHFENRTWFAGWMSDVVEIPVYDKPRKE